MSTHEADTKSEDVIVGRNGLLLPRPETILRYDPADGFLSFFQRLWVVNGFEPKSRDSSHNQSPVPDGFSHELVLPATEDKPLLVLKGSLVPRDKQDVEYETRRSRERSERGSWSSVTSGTEEHGIYVPPTELGAFEPLLKVTYSHQHGGSGNNFSSNTYVQRLGEYISERDFEPDGINMLVAEYRQIARDAHSKYMEELLSETIEFLS